MDEIRIEGNIVDIPGRKVFPGEVIVRQGKIVSINPLNHTVNGYIMPGFVDAHIHIESSMLVPTEFSRIAIRHGTVATVSDPHEIANVLGVEGIEFMIKNGKQAALKFFFGASSCVPATAFETAGAELTADDIEYLLSKEEILYLSEMMNYPAVIADVPDVIEILELARRKGKPIDGHAPGLRGEGARKYFGHGISTDHECYSIEEAREKVALGVKIIIREGSAAKNYTALHPLFSECPQQLMFCSDDKHPDDLLHGHINQLVARAVGDGHDLYQVLWSACIHPVQHYNLPVGTLRTEDPADFIVVEDLENLKVMETYIDGVRWVENGQSIEERVPVTKPNHFHTKPKQPLDFALSAELAESDKLLVIEAIDNELITEKFWASAKVVNGLIESQPEKDILKIAVVNRYTDRKPAVGFVKGFGLKEGAIASSVAHDSHNIIAVGTDDQLLCRAVNQVIEHRGGIAATASEQERILPLPVAGLMSADNAIQVASQYSNISEFAKIDLGSTLTAPFMTLSFMGLLVIPKLKLSDKGLFDGEAFAFVSRPAND